MPSNYYDSSDATLAERVDEAWADYKEVDLSDYQHKCAIKFLMYVFNLKKLSDDKEGLNKALETLMALRNQKKAENPHYVPILHSGSYHFDKTARILTATEISHTSPDTTIQAAFESGELLDVYSHAKITDCCRKPTFLHAEERASFNLDIYNGLFYKDGEIFDSARSISHQKPRYIAFTLNTNGELSVFNHLDGEVDEKGYVFVHSSMNSGAPVLAAGEMEIVNGQLITITSFSDHYKPTLFSIARFLEYLCDREMDLSKTKVLLFYSPNTDTGLQSIPIKVEGSRRTWHSISAIDIIKNANGVIEDNIATMQNYLNSKKTKFKQKIIKIDLTIKKVELFHAVIKELNDIKQIMKGSSSYLVLRESLKAIDQIIMGFQDAYKRLRPRGIGRVGIIFEEMRARIHQASLPFASIDEAEEELKFDSYKQLR